MRQALPFVIKATCPFYSGSWLFSFSLVHKLSLLIKSFACLRVMWKQYSFPWYYCPRRIWKGPGISNRHRESSENTGGRGGKGTISLTYFLIRTSSWLLGFPCYSSKNISHQRGATQSRQGQSMKALENVTIFGNRVFADIQVKVGHQSGP